MYEGKNIHYSPVDNRPLCSFSGKVCRQRRLNGYALCLRHILEDISAPYKRCINLARNGQQCSNVIPQSRNTDYCNSHANSQAVLASTPGLAPSGLSMSPSPKTLPSTNGFDPSINAALLNSSPAQINDLHLTPLNGPDVKTSVHHPPGQDKTTSNHVSGSDDPYAFPSDPEPVRRAAQVTYGSVPQTFPSLSQALATMAATAKVGQPQVYESNHATRTDAGVSSIAKLYPELADKLEIGKKSPKNEPTKGKTTLSSPSNNKSSRTMNRLQTKIAQNKIKDKLKKSSTCLDLNTTPNYALSNAKASHTENVTKLTLTEPAESVEKNHISTTSSSVADIGNHEKKSRSRNKSKSSAKVKGTNATKPETTIPRPLGHFPALESRLQTSPLVNPWAAPIFNIPASIPVQIEDKKQLYQHMGPPVPFLAPRTPVVPEVPFMPCHDLEANQPGTSMGPVLDTLKPSFPVVPVPYIGPTMELPPPEHVLPAVQNTTPCEVKAMDTDHRSQSTTLCSNKGSAQSDLQTSLKPGPSIMMKPAAPEAVPSPLCVKYRCYKSKYSMKEVCERVKRRSALQICVASEKRKRRSCNLIPMGVDSSEDDTSDYEEWLPAQKEWLISSSESEEDEDMLDDPLLANIRHTKQSLLQAKLRRYFLQSQKAHNGNHCLHSTNKRDIATLLSAARFDPHATAEALKLVLHVAKVSNSSQAKTLYGKRVCLCKGDQDKACADQALPFTNQCNKHIMYNVEQQLYDYCTAKFSDNTQCCIPVFDIRHELPLCPEHAAKAENYQKNLEASRPKKPRKKTKPSALTRPPKKGKKKKNQRKLNQAEKGGTPSVTDATSGDERSQQLDVEGPCGNDQSEASIPASPPPCISSPDEAKDDLDVPDGLGNELEESFSPGTIDKHLELPLGEQDLNEVLNKLPVDAFELFAGKNGEFVNSHMEEEAAAFEHVLAETSKKMKATEVSSRLMMMDPSGISVQNRLMEDGRNDDEITKEIADSILQQELSPSVSIVDDLGQDNISALASSLSVHDLGNISQVLNASLINATSSCDLNNSLYGTTPIQQAASLQQGLQMMTHSGHSTRNHCPIPSSSGLGHGTASYPYLHTSVANAYLVNTTPTGLLSHGNTVQNTLPITPQRQLPEVAATPGAQNGTPSSQSIAQILASLTAGTKQFTGTQSGDSQLHASHSYTSVASIDNFLQSPPDKSIGLIPSQSTVGHQLSTSMDNHYRVPPSSVLFGSPPNTYLHGNSTSASMQIGSNINHQPQVGPKIPQTALHNGLLTMPNFNQQQQNVNAFALPIGSAASPLGLKLACPLQTLVPVELLNSSLAQGHPGVGPVTGNVLTNNGQPLVTMTNASTVLPIATGQAQGSTPGKA